MTQAAALAANITAGLPGSMESWTLDDVRALPWRL
jgi:hypothetical protein